MMMQVIGEDVEVEVRGRGRAIRNTEGDVGGKLSSIRRGRNRSPEEE
jgi:hypothetical protein